MFRTAFGLVCIVWLSATLSGEDVIGSAPIPAQIGAAKRGFVSNMGGQCVDFSTPGFNAGLGQPLAHGRVSGAAPTAYDGIYAALKSWGRYDLTAAPADADLVFQIRVSCPFSGKESHPVLDLQILDPKTHVSLWGFVEEADPAALQKNRDTNFERAVARIVKDVKNLLASVDAPATGTR
jgi:hypothetical protein